MRTARDRLDRRLVRRLRRLVNHGRAGRARKRAAPSQEELVARYAPGRSFADIGCMWGVHGALSFLAEESGATSVTGFDAMDRTPEFDAEHRRRGSKVRFVRGDLHDPGTPAAVGAHEVVYCSGLLYHTPNPVLAIDHLSWLAEDLLIVGTKALPEIAGAPQAAVLYPGLNESQRHVYRPYWGGVTGRFDDDPVRGYANWWWGLTPSALTAMVGLAFDVVEVLELPFHDTRDNCFVVGRRKRTLEQERARLDAARQAVAAGRDSSGGDDQGAGDGASGPGGGRPAGSFEASASEPRMPS